MTEIVTLTCSLCHYDLPQDDIALETSHRHTIICQRCWAEHTETTKPMPKDLRETVTRIVNEAP